MGTELRAGAVGNPNTHQLDTPELVLERHYTFSNQSFQIGVLQEDTVLLLVKHIYLLPINSNLAPF